MVKRQKEKQYQSAREHKVNSAWRNPSSASASSSSSFRRLPFTHCALTLQPYTDHPMCNPANPTVLYDSSAIVPFVWKWKRDPCTGEPLTSKQLVRLVMDRSSSSSSSTSLENKDRDDGGEWQCPILCKKFADHTKIVAIRQPSSSNNDDKDKDDDENIAHVYSYQAYHELNVQAKNYTDLISGHPFDPKRDVLVIRDPEHLDQIPVVENFYYIRHAHEFPQNNDDNSNNNGNNNIQYSATASRILAQLEKKKKDSSSWAMKQPSVQSSTTTNTSNSTAIAVVPTTTSLGLPILVQDVTGVTLTTAQGAAASFTSTDMHLSTTNAARPATIEEIVQGQCNTLRRLKQKALVRLFFRIISKNNDMEDDDEEEDNDDDDDASSSNNNNNNQTKGSMVVEIHCDVTPRTAMNFLGLCAAGRYNGTTFHRLIPNFMVQGGKASSKIRPRNDKKGDSTQQPQQEQEDSSIWGGAFSDELDKRFQHDGRGVLAMANAGPNTNKQQFYITFAACPHLDGKHTVFGKVIEGMSVLDDMEKVGRDAKDRPLSTIRLERAEILSSPVEQALEKERKRIEKAQLARLKKAPPQQQPSSATTSNCTGEPALKKIKLATKANRGDDDANKAEPTIGRYLQNRLASRPTASSGGGGGATIFGATAASKKKDATNKQKKSSFGNFSSW